MKAPQRSFQRLLTPTEKAKIDSEIRELEMGLKSPDLVGLGMWAPNPTFSAAHSAEPMRQLAKLKRRKEEGSVEDFSESTVRQREAQIKELSEWCASRMVPRKFYHAKRKDSKDYTKTVDHLVKVEMGTEFRQKAEQLKNLLRARSENECRLSGSTENPASGNIEYLRK